MDIFISYRRADSADISGRIFDRLEQHFGRGKVLKDVDSIQPGHDFRREIESFIQRCDVVLAIIGPLWMGPGAGRLGSRTRRIDNPDDMVRVELELSIRSGIAVIPVLVGGATMPTFNGLPASLSSVANLQAINLRGDPDFRRDMDVVISSIEKAQTEAEWRAQEEQRTRELKEKEEQRKRERRERLDAMGPDIRAIAGDARIQLATSEDMIRRQLHLNQEVRDRLAYDLNALEQTLPLLNQTLAREDLPLDPSPENWAGTLATALSRITQSLHELSYQDRALLDEQQYRLEMLSDVFNRIEALISE